MAGSAHQVLEVRVLRIRIAQRDDNSFPKLRIRRACRGIEAARVDKEAMLFAEHKCLEGLDHPVAEILGFDLGDPYVLLAQHERLLQNQALSTLARWAAIASATRASVSTLGLEKISRSSMIWSFSFSAAMKPIVVGA